MWGGTELKDKKPDVVGKGGGSALELPYEAIGVPEDVKRAKQSTGLEAPIKDKISKRHGLEEDHAELVRGGAGLTCTCGTIVENVGCSTVVFTVVFGVFGAGGRT